MNRPPKGGAERWEQHDSQARKTGRSALSTSDRLGDSTNITKLAAIGTRRPDVYTVQIHSHPDVGPNGGRALAAAVALNSQEVLAGAPEGAAQNPADP